MLSTHVPKYFWREAVLTAAYLMNRMPFKILKFLTPCQVLQTFSHTKIISSLPTRIFGCSVFIHIHKKHRSKLDHKFIKCIFLGYSPNQKGYKCYSPITKNMYNLNINPITKNTHQTKRDVAFFEHQSYYPKYEIQGENMSEHQLWDTLKDVESHLDHTLQPGDSSQPSQPNSIHPEVTDHIIQSPTIDQYVSLPPTSPL